MADRKLIIQSTEDGKKLTGRQGRIQNKVSFSGGSGSGILKPWGGNLLVSVAGGQLQVATGVASCDGCLVENPDIVTLLTETDGDFTCYIEADLLNDTASISFTNETLVKDDLTNDVEGVYQLALATFSVRGGTPENVKMVANSIVTQRTNSENDARYVNVTGDQMSGKLTITSGGIDVTGYAYFNTNVYAQTNLSVKGFIYNSGGNNVSINQPTVINGSITANSASLSGRLSAGSASITGSGTFGGNLTTTGNVYTDGIFEKRGDVGADGSPYRWYSNIGTNTYSAIFYDARYNDNTTMFRIGHSSSGSGLDNRFTYLSNFDTESDGLEASLRFYPTFASTGGVRHATSTGVKRLMYADEGLKQGDSIKTGTVTAGGRITAPSLVINGSTVLGANASDTTHVNGTLYATGSATTGNTVMGDYFQVNASTSAALRQKLNVNNGNMTLAQQNFVDGKVAMKLSCDRTDSSGFKMYLIGYNSAGDIRHGMRYQYNEKTYDYGFRKYLYYTSSAKTDNLDLWNAIQMLSLRIEAMDKSNIGTQAFAKSIASSVQKAKQELDQAIADDEAGMKIA